MNLLFSILLLLSACKVSDYDSGSKPVTHEMWNALVKKHVTADGWVDYKGFMRDSNALNEYLALLESHHPNDEHWSREQRMAYWINAYNAYTVELILDHYPVESIKDIKSGIPFVNTVWDIKFIEIEGQEYDLNNIEHGILRPKFNDARIHFALNCASESCPVLRGEAFTAERLDEQLTDAAEKFLADERRNKLSPERVQLSKIFDWYKGDFTDNMSLIEYINQFATVKVEQDAEVDYLDYSWKLNDAGMY